MTNEDLNRLKELERQVSDVYIQIEELEKKKLAIRAEMANIRIKPFKVGDTVMCEVPNGRSKNKKLQKCVIEVGGVVGDTVYVRPIKENGELSGRHFAVFFDSFTPRNRDITEIFRKCCEE